jgi:PPM family protein phosphatase
MIAPVSNEVDRRTAPARAPAVLALLRISHLVSGPFSMNHGAHCPTFALEVAHLSDLGMRRLNNQDSLAVVVTEDAAKWSSRGHLMIIADGMGAHAAGELASKLAVDNISHAYFKLRDLQPPAALRQAIRDTNALIYARGQSNIGFQGMGTTCSCLVLLPQGALVAHVGDSRVYRLRDGRLAQLTFDHSLVWEMAAAGHMSQEDVPSYIPKNVITRSLGPHENVNVDLEGLFDVAAGDVFLLCSDGLSGQISDAEIGALLHVLTPEEAVQTLVDLANLRGGPDNISVVVARVVGGEAPVSKRRSKAGQDSAAGSAARQAPSVLFQVVSVAALFALALCLVNQWWVASAIAGAALIAGVSFLAAGRSSRSAASTATFSLGGPYGNGPYRDTPIESDAKMVASLAEMTEKLRNLPDGQGPKIDWTPLDESMATGKAEAASGDYRQAIGGYAAGLRAVMQQLRQHRLTATDDSGIYRP